MCIENDAIRKLDSENKYEDFVSRKKPLAIAQLSKQ